MPRLPMSDRPVENQSGHWLLAQVGKKVLRPGGRELTEKMLSALPIHNHDVVELAPGLGKTAEKIVAEEPSSYTGVDEDPDAAHLAAAAAHQAASGHMPANAIRVLQGRANNTTLDDESVDVAVGEAMLTMQGDKGKAAIVEEAHRILRLGGRYAIHELGLQPNDLSDDTKTEVRKALARSIKVNARPLTEHEWQDLLTSHGFEVETTHFAPMALLEPKRIISDEGILRTLKIAFNIATKPNVRKRVMGMRQTFQKYENELTAIAIVAKKK